MMAAGETLYHRKMGSLKYDFILIFFDLKPVKSEGTVMTL